MLLVNPSPVYSIVNVTMLLRPFHAHHTSCIVLGPYLSTCIYVVSNVRCAFILNKFSCSVETWYLGIFVFPVKKVSSSRRITFFPFLSFFTTNKRAKSRNIFSLWCRRERERCSFRSSLMMMMIHRGWVSANTNGFETEFKIESN